MADKSSGSIGPKPDSGKAAAPPQARALAVPRRAIKALLRGLQDSFFTIVFLLKIIIPVTLLVAMLNWSGLLASMAKILAPAMRLLGLPGEAALVFLSGALLNNYSAIAVAGTLALSLREFIILAVMCLIAHNLPVETAVMKKAGSSAIKMLMLRIGMSLVAGVLCNALLPHSFTALPFSAGMDTVRRDFGGMLLAWLVSSGKLVLNISLIVAAIMVVQRLLEAFHVMDILSRLFAPLMRMIGLPEKASFLWIVINVAGYAYGAGIIVDQVKSGGMSSREGDLFNHHAAICHSLLEDTALYAALGLPLFWLIVPRFALSVIVVWAERLRRRFFMRSFRAGLE